MFAITTQKKNNLNAMDLVTLFWDFTLDVIIWATG
jgi:hypothetical protein